MPPRLFFPTLLLGVTLSAVTAAHADDAEVSRWLATAFTALPEPDRLAVQDELSLSGLYTGPIDGQDSAETELALLYSLDFIADNSMGHVLIPMTDADDASAYVRSIGQHERSAWLYGEGEEGE